MNVRKYQSTSYRNPPCWRLVAHVLFDRGIALPDFSPDCADHEKIATAFRIAIHGAPGWAERVDMPQDYDMVLMARCERMDYHHIGIWWKGRILHALPSGVWYQPPSTLQDEFKKPFQNWRVK